MRKVDIAKLALSLCAVVLIGYGIKTDQTYFRWAGIGCLAVAVMLRFAGRRQRLD